MANYPEFVNEEGYLTNEPAIVRAAAAKIGADHVYYFNYDWRLDPMLMRKNCVAMWSEQSAKLAMIK